MTDANPEGSNTPEPAPRAADESSEPTDDADNEPTEPPQKPASSKPGRSTTLVALAGILATLIGTATGAYFTYRTSSDTVHADAERANVDSRKTAYTDYLNAEADHWLAAQQLSVTYSHFAKGEEPYGSIVDQTVNYNNTLRGSRRASSEVELVASHNIFDMVNVWTVYDNYVQSVLFDIRMAADKACGHGSSTSPACGQVPDVANRMPTVERAVNTDSQPRIQMFVQVAQVDLGLSDKSVCHPDQDIKAAAQIWTKSPASSLAPWLVPWSCK